MNAPHTGPQAPPEAARATDWPLVYSAAGFAHAKDFVFRRWCELALERQEPPPQDLSGACRYGSMFMREVFGGAIEGHYAHQCNRSGGRLIDLSHDAADVGRMRTPYLHDADFFLIPLYQARLEACRPRVTGWAADFRLETADRRLISSQNHPIPS